MSTLTQKVKKELYQLVFWQLIIIVGLALILFLLYGMRTGFSALVGGLSYWLPTLLFIWRLSAHTGARAAKQFVVAFFTGEAFKLFLSGLLFVLAIKYLPVILFDVLIGFIGAVIAFWIVSILSVYRQGARK